jgi:hypothetical protein
MPFVLFAKTTVILSLFGKSLGILSNSFKQTHNLSHWLIILLIVSFNDSYLAGYEVIATVTSNFFLYSMSLSSLLRYSYLLIPILIMLIIVTVCSIPNGLDNYQYQLYSIKDKQNLQEIVSNSINLPV